MLYYTHVIQKAVITLTKVLSFFKHRRSDIDMTEGSIFGNLLRFAFPLLIGNFFQQLYNLVDTWVIGQTDEAGAYAAVGSVGPIINILIGFFLGLSSGAGVIISQYYGAKNEKKVQDTVHTAAVLTLVLGVLFTIIGVTMTPWISQLMLGGDETTSVTLPYARTYLTIYFAGVIGLMIYNMGSGILRAIGDSEHPFYFLCVSALTNIVLDLVFVFVFDMGVAGVALATVTAQALSAVLTVIVLVRTKTCVRLDLRRLRPDMEMLGKIFRVGIPAAIQMAITAFANVFVQSYIAGTNAVQEHCLGGWTSYSKIDALIFLPMQSLALATTTFVGQNLGKGNIERAKKGARTAFSMSLVASAVLISIIVIFAPWFASLINDDPEIVRYATMFLYAITPCMLVCSVNQIFSGALRGAGNTKAPMFIMLSTFVGFRQLYLFIMSNFISNDPLPVGMGYPAGWFACAIVTLIYYSHFKFEKSRLINESKA